MSLDVKLDKTDPAHVKVSVAGVMNENWPRELTTLPSEIGDTVTFNFAGLTSINSYGIRNWASFIRDICQGRTVYFDEVPSVMIMQINVIPEIRSSAHVQSFFGDFLCEDCGVEMTHKYTTPISQDEALSKSSELKCAECEEPVEMEVDIDSYFVFLDQE